MAIFLGKLWIRDSRALSTGRRLDDLSSCKPFTAPNCYVASRTGTLNSVARDAEVILEFAASRNILPLLDAANIYYTFVHSSRYRVRSSDHASRISRRERREYERRLSRRTSGTSRNGAPFRRVFHASLICHRRGFILVSLKRKHLRAFRASLCPASGWLEPFSRTFY